jgi:lysozyme
MAQGTPSRIVIAALSVSAAAFAALTLDEGYTDTAVIPVKGDRPTVGFGSTFREDGSPVELGDTITPPQAVKRSLAHIAKDEAGLKRCLEGVAMSQAEYDLLVDFSYQYGAGTACSSGMAQRMREGDYAGACDVYLEYRKVRINGALYDCSTPGNRVCGGVWTRAQKRHKTCMESQ